MTARPKQSSPAVKAGIYTRIPSDPSGQLAGVDDGTIGRTLSDLGAAQSRLQGLDDDFYVRGVLAEGRYWSIRVKLEREIDRLHALVDAGSKQRIVLHPDPRVFWPEGVQQRRDLVRPMIERVEVMPGRPALRRFDASRLQIQGPTFATADTSPPARDHSGLAVTGSHYGRAGR